jgi:MYXO-CTERM domain-containing protein
MCGTWRAWAALVVVLAAAGPARAFYWHGWPGSQLRVEPTLIGPPVPLAPLSPTEGPPPDPVILNPVPPLGPPTPTPEPATALLGALGLGALALRSIRRRG